MTLKKWLIGNWKMHGSIAFNNELVEGICKGLPERNSSVGVAICPPFPYLQQVTGLLQGSAVALGAQNLSEHARGAYTGEVSGPMLNDLGVRFVLVGHSERRGYHAEDDELIACKVRAALDAGLIPVLCVGETQQEREAGQTKAVLVSQVDTALKKINIAAESIMIAYEPRWAIGTGVSATPEMIADVHDFLRGYLCAQGQSFGQNTAILYGGSMNAGNAACIAAIGNVDGGLIGSAALKADEFVAIYQALLGMAVCE